MYLSETLGVPRDDQTSDCHPFVSTLHTTHFIDNEDSPYSLDSPPFVSANSGALWLNIGCTDPEV